MTRITGGEGFTLVELAIVMAVVGIALALGLPSLQTWKERVDLRDAATGVAELMLAARSRAVVERREYTVSVDYGTDSLVTAPALGSPRRWGAVDLHADTTDPDCPPLTGQAVVFRPNGTADAVGFEGVYLRSRSARTAVRYRVKVLGATAKVGVERSTGGAWAGAY